VLEDPDRPTPPSEPLLPTGSETILIVEDEEMVRTLARRVLERQGYRVLEASDGESAQLACSRHPGCIDLLLTDVVMPR